ncbi:ATP-binding protein, partial [Streptomyces decoyicus]
MKQGTIKTLGTVALGAAFVVTAAGVASAAPAAGSSDTTGVLKSLPVKDAAKTVSGLTKSKPAGHPREGRSRRRQDAVRGGRGDRPAPPGGRRGPG